MVRNTYLKALHWILSNLACATMAFSPVALGAEAETISQIELQQTIHEFALDKKTTVGEFWQKSKAYFPEYLQKDMEKLAKENQNKLMPEMTLSSAKASDGSVVPVLRMTENGSTSTVQIFGEKNKWAKYNNIILSENDLRSFKDAYIRLVASDYRLRKQIENQTKIKQSQNKNKTSLTNAALVKKRLQQAKDLARFEGFPRITPVVWKSMSREQRAGYIVRMRNLWARAQRVLDLEAEMKPAAKKAQKTSKLDSNSVIEQRTELEFFYHIIFGAEAEAGGKLTMKPGAARAFKKEELSNPDNQNRACKPESGLSGRACITAGLVAGENDNKYSLVYNSTSQGKFLTCACSYEGILSSKPAQELEKLQNLADQCAYDNTENTAKIPNADKGSWVACNPILYSYQPTSGRPFCVHTMSPGFQRATTFSTSGKLTASCDEQARLSTTEFKVKDNQGKYLSEDDRLKQIEKEQTDNPEKDFLQTRQYIDGILKSDGSNTDLKDLLNGAWDPAKDKKLVDIQAAFENEIRLATASCSKNIGKAQESNYSDACDQLHRRWLFTEKYIAQFREKMCAPGTVYVGKYLEGESTLSEKNKVKTTINKTVIDATGKNLCECSNVSIKVCDVKDPTKCDEEAKKVNFGQSCTPDAPPNPNTDPTKCPDPMTSVEGGSGNEKLCACPGNPTGFPLAEVLVMSLDQGGKLCDKPSENHCGKPDSIAGYDYEQCKCIKGELEDENAPGFLAKAFQSNADKKESKWVCEESSVWPWVAGAAGLAALAAILLHKDKNHKAKTPVGSCAPKSGVPPACFCPILNTCNSIGQKYNMSTCACDSVAVCADGTPKSKPTTSMPDGCPVANEGGSGQNTCTNPPCNGGVPAAN